MSRSSWNDAAATAPFRFYEPVEPPPASVSAGGSGYDGDRPVHLAVEADLDGTEVSVDSWALGGASHSSQRGRIARLVSCKEDPFRL
jgi:hypothetical protein